MFERLMKRGAALADRRAALRRERLASRLEEKAPGGIAVAIEDEHVVLSARGLARRAVTDPAVRWLMAEARDER